MKANSITHLFPWAALGLVLVGAPTLAAADEAPATAEVAEEPGSSVELAVSANTAIATDYVFRGLPQYSRPAPSSQSTVGLGVSGVGPGTLSLSVWNATAMIPRKEDVRVEIDLTVSYDLQLTDALGLGMGYVGYFYPLAQVRADVGHELFLTAGYDLGVLSSFAGIYVDPFLMKSVYATAGVTRDFGAGPVTVTPTASLGLAGGGGGAYFNDLTLALAATWAVVDPLYLSLSGSFSYLGDPDPVLSFDDRTSTYMMLTAGIDL